ncbi:MAG: prolyl oligopeptidase family serine peptidase, partial [Opitutaceae bacterium]|nr:prolyl oligopeptidase family serine peptidase [Opitutaceae bacterium]
DDINKIKSQTGPLWSGIQEFGQTPCFLVAPQCVSRGDAGPRGGWQLDNLNAFLTHLKATLPVDEQRIYLTGNSMGGYGAWLWGGNTPEHFAAVAPVSGGIGPGGPKDVTDRLEAWAANLATIPVYAFVGGKDTVVPPERSESMVAAIRAAGGEQVELKTYPDEKHNVRRVVYATVEFYDWLFSHRRD